MTSFSRARPSRPKQVLDKRSEARAVRGKLQTSLRLVSCCCPSPSGIESYAGTTLTPECCCADAVGSATCGPKQVLAICSEVCLRMICGNQSYGTLPCRGARIRTAVYRSLEFFVKGTSMRV